MPETYYYGKVETIGHSDFLSGDEFIRLDLSHDFFNRVFSARCKLIELQRQFPSLSHLSFYSDATFGDFGNELPTGEPWRRLNDGFLTSLSSRLDAKFAPLGSPDHPDHPDHPGEQFEYAHHHGLELRLTAREEGDDLVFVAPWWELVSIYSSRQCRFSVTETAAALARGIVADRAFDRLPILADALADGEGLGESAPPPWLGFVLRETDPFELGGCRHQLVLDGPSVLAARIEPSDLEQAQFSPFFLSLCVPTPSA